MLKIYSIQLRAICAVFVCVLLFVPGLSHAQPGNDSYCASTGRIVVYAVDITTPYDQTDKTSIIALTDRILKSLRGGERIIVRTIAESHTRSERLIERCVPYCPADGAFGRLFNCSDGLIRTNSERVRQEIIASLRARIAKFEELKYSDIVRTIETIAKEDARDGRPFSLYIYSDLIENSDYFSPRYLFSYSVKRLIDGLHAYNLIAPLKGAEVTVSGVGRWDGRDRRPLAVKELNKLTEFWKAYFNESGAAKIGISQNP